jgi:Ca-activated chloride channel family protein
MSFSDRGLLILAVVLPLLIAFFLVRYVRRRRMVIRTLGEARLIARLGGADLRRVPVERFALLLPAALALGIAAAGPHWGIKAVEGESRSLNVVLALDISKSMLARDVSPNRLERERLLVRRLLRDLAQERVGMIVFAGRAYILAPLTSDQGALQLFVDALDPDIVSQGGSSLAAAVSLSADLARGPQGAAGERAVILITDGEAHESEDDIVRAAEDAGAEGVRFFAVAVGTERGAPVPEIDPATHRLAGYKRDPYGNTVISRTNPGLLRKIANATGGKMYDLSGGASTDDLMRQLRKLQRTPGTTDAGVEPRDQTAWFVALALLLLALDAVLARRARSGLPVAAPQRAAAAILLLWLFGTGFAIGELERGNRYYRSGRYTEAVREYEKAIANGNTTPEVRYNLGTAMLQLGRYEEAEQHLRLALRELRPEVRQRAYYNLGNRYLENARKGADQQGAPQLLDAAVEAYKHALRLEPGDFDAKWNLELALREKEKQNKSPSGGESQQQPSSNDQQSQSPSAGGTGGSSSQSQSQAGQGRQRGQTYEQRPMSQEQADRILSAVEQDERQLTREKLRKGERRTPVTRDW